MYIKFMYIYIYILYYIYYMYYIYVIYILYTELLIFVVINGNSHCRCKQLLFMLDSRIRLAISIQHPSNDLCYLCVVFPRISKEQDTSNFLI